MASTPNYRNGRDESKEETHTPKFRGTFAPADLHYLLSEEKISCTEFVLLQIIDSLVDARGEGCYASNGYLAKRIGKSAEHVRTMLRHLKSLGLIKQVGWKRIGIRDFRCLETKWSRVEMQQVECEAEDIENDCTAVIDNRGTEVVHNRQRILSKESIKETERSAPALPPLPPPPKSKSKQEEKVESSSSAAPHRADAFKLRDSLRSQHRHTDTFSPDKWAKELRLTEKELQEGIYRKVFDWYCEHCSVEDQDKYRLPSIASAKQFRVHFDWIYGCYRKATQPKQVPEWVKEKQEQEEKWW